MVLEIGLEHHIVNEARSVLDTGCICCRVRTVKSKMEVEVRELCLDFCVVLKIECLHKVAGSIEEMNLLLCLEGLEELHDVAAERCHTGSTSHEDILL